MDEQATAASGSLREIIREVAALRKTISAVRGKQLQSTRVKDQVRAVVQLYFRSVRPLLMKLTVDVRAADTRMQRLMELASRNSSISVYKICISEIVADLNALEIHSEQRMSDLVGKVGAVDMSAVEGRILETFGSMLPATALSYKQVLADLNTSDQFSYRGPATELREILRETLDHLAPDKDVIASPGFQLEKERTKPTMAQKARYILRLRGVPKNSIDVPRKAIEIVEATVSAYVRSTYDRGSIDTHTSTGINKAGVSQLKMYVDSVLCELLEIHSKP